MLVLNPVMVLLLERTLLILTTGMPLVSCAVTLCSMRAEGFTSGVLESLLVLVVRWRFLTVLWVTAAPA